MDQFGYAASWPRQASRGSDGAQAVNGLEGTAGRDQGMPQTSMTKFAIAYTTLPTVPRPPRRRGTIYVG
jgi:hypothetical protein